MTRCLGIAGVQMSPVPWDRSAAVDKMAAAMDRIARNFPWVDLVLFHELCTSSVAQFAPVVRAGGRMWRNPFPGRRPSVWPRWHGNTANG